MALVGSAAVGWPLAARAQQARSFPLIGFLNPGFPTYTGSDSAFILLKEGLREVDLVEGETFRIEARWGLGKTETIPAFAEELVRLKVDLLVAIARPSIEAAKSATRELPIVALDLESDPVASGFVTSLAAPGGNITGLFLNAPSLTGKWLQLIREVVPDARRIAVLWDANTGEYQLRAMSAAAKAMSIDLQVVEFRNAAGMESALSAGLKERPQALIQLGSPLINQLANRIADISATHRIPAISMFRSGLSRKVGHHVVRAGPSHLVPPPEPLRFHHSQGCQARSRAGGTADQFRIGREPESCHGDGPHDPAGHAAAR
jgi:putative ABC transport system substrate-binding protein